MSPVFRLSFAFAFNHNVSHSGAVHRKELCRISKSETLASECDPRGKMGEWGKAVGVALNVGKAETCLRTP